MSRFPYIVRKHIFAILLGLILVLAVGPRLVQATSPAQKDLREVWLRVQQAGEYGFSARLTQTLMPRATLVNAGRDKQITQVQMEGQTNLDEEAMHLRLWSNGGSVLDPETAIEFRVEDGEAFMRQGSGSWEKADDVTSLIAPGGDFMVYVEAAKNVERHAPQLLKTPQGRVMVTRYTYEVDGPRFAAKMHEQMVAQATRDGMPSGVQVQVPKVYLDMTGTGELWVGPNGLPLRQSFSLQFPEREDNYVPNVEASIDFSDFGALPTATALGQATYAGGQMVKQALHTNSMVSVLTVLLAVLMTIALVVYRRSRRVYAGLALTILVSMIISPLMRSDRVYAYSERQFERQTEIEAQRADFDSQRDVQAKIEEPAIDPHVDPLARANAVAQLQATNVVTQTDEYIHPSCTSDPDGDIDNDGLTNIEECRLGTLPNVWDTDDDAVSDYLEVNGFQIDGVTWYSNPFDADTNRDGIVDGLEWVVGGDGVTPPDSDGDGTPDLWDEDNDNDGVPDTADLSPYSYSDMNTPFSADAPFTLDVSDLIEDKMVKVQFQLRTSNADHLWLINNVLDWPDGDTEGQIQDADGKTFFDVDPNLSASPNSNGDMRLVPLLEIMIPVQSSNVLSSELNSQLGISVVSVDENTDAAYVPLQLVTDDFGAQNVAFNGTMFYRANSEWGDAQHVRLVWMVQGLLDQCQTVVDSVCTEWLYNQEQPIQLYEDSWYLTGLQVIEEHDSQLGVIYEDPTQTQAQITGDDRPLYLDALYGLADGLDYTFLGAIDCESQDGDGNCVGNGELDWTVDEIVRRFDYDTNDSVSADERWNLPDVFGVDKVQSESVELATAQVSITETQRILDDAFTPAWTEQSPITPTILFAMQNKVRSLNLDAISPTDEGAPSDKVVWNDSNLTMALSQTGDSPTTLNTTMGLKWAPYVYDPITGWASQDITAFWDDMNALLGSEFSDIGDEGQANTYQTMGQMAYLALYQGTTTTAQAGDLILARTTAPIDDILTSTMTQANQQYMSTLVLLYYDWSPELAEAAGYMNPELFKLNIGQPEFIVSYVGVQVADFFRAQRLTQQIKNDFMGGNIVAYDEVNDVYLTQNGKQYVFIDNEDGTTYQQVDYQGNEVAQESNSTSMGMWIVAITVILILLYVAIYALQSLDLNGTLGQIVRYAAAVVKWAMRVTALISVLELLKSIILAVRAAYVTGSYAQLASVLTAETTAATVGLAALALLIQVGVALGIFFYLWANGRISPGTVGFNYTLGYTLAAIIVAIVLFVFVVLTGGIGGIVLLLITTVDAWLRVFGVKFQILGSFTEIIAGIIYQFDLQVYPQVATGTLGIDLVNPVEGLVDGNQVVVSLPVTTEITSTASTLTSNSFEYSLTMGEEKLSTSRGERKHDYVLDQVNSYSPFGVISATHALLADRPAVTTTLAAQVNYRPITMTFNSAFALRGQSCWFLVCSAKFIKGSDSSTIGYGIVLDVLPATLDEFLDVAGWSSSSGRVDFPDKDGDGLLPYSRGGLDPDDSTWDADGDGLSDTFELTARDRSQTGGALYLDPLSSDTDSDGILDRDELLYSGNPSAADGDNDGLTDAEEIPPFGGWMVPYAVDKEALVWSSAFVADTDSDGLSDLFERTQIACPDCDPWAEDEPIIYNPNVWNPNPVPLYVSDNTVNGYVKPGATVIYTATTANNLTGGQQLDGRLATSPLGGFTGAPLAADVAISSNQSQSLVSVLTAGSQAGSFTLESTMSLADFDTIVWTMQRTVTETVGTVAGANAQEIVGTAAPVGWSTPYLLVSRETSGGVATINAYLVRADSQVLGEAVLYTGAVTETLTAPSVSCADDGHCSAAWGINDDTGLGSVMAVQMYKGLSGPTLVAVWDDANSTVHAPIVSGDGDDYLVAWLAESGGAAKVMVQPLPHDTDLQVGTSTLAGPSADLAGVTTAWNGVNYDVIWSDNEELQRAQVDHLGQTVNAAVGLGTGGGWPTSDGDIQAPVLIFDERSQQSLLLYRGTIGGVALAALRLNAASVAGSLTLDSNAALTGNDTSVALCADPVNGGWIAGWSQPNVNEVLYQPLAPDGTLRGVRKVEASVDNNSVVALACSEPRPLLEWRFEEPSGSAYFADTSGYGNDVTCSGDLCPLSGVGGRVGSGVNFDGTNDALTVYFKQSDDTFSTDLWLRTTKQSEEILLRQGDFERIYIENGNLCAWVQKSGGPDAICSSGENYADGLWHHIAHVSDGSNHQLYVNGELATTSGSLSNLNFCTGSSQACMSFTLAAANSYGSVFQGDMDEVHYHDRALTGAEVSDIFEAALAVYSLDEVAGITTLSDSSDNGFTAVCSGDTCPTLGVEGMAYTAAEFDGTDDVLVIDTVPQVDAIYAYDFNGATAAGVPSEWSPDLTQTNYFRGDQPEEFIGLTTHDTLTLDLVNLPPHDTVDIDLDLYLVGSWDGNTTRKPFDNSNGEIIGPDTWTWSYYSNSTGTVDLLNTTFTLDTRAGFNQSYPGAPPTSMSGITLYGDTSCQNRETTLTSDTPDLSQSAVGDGTVGNNNASCYKFSKKDTVAALFEDKDYGSKVLVLDSKAVGTSATSLKGSGGFNDSVGSVALWSSGNAAGYGATGEVLRVGTTVVPSAVYELSKSFSHTANDLQFLFGSSILGLNEGSFGLDNVIVKVKSDKSSIPLTNSSFTLSAWAKRNSNGTNQYILSQGTAAQNQGLIFGFNSSNQFGCAFWQNGLWTTDQYTDTEWHHWACTYDADTNLRTIYRDGVQVAQNTAAADYSGFGPTYIGALFDNTNYFDGTLDEVAAWPTALSANQIAELYAKVKAQDETVLVGLSPEVADQPQIEVSSFTLRETTTLLGSVRQTVSRTLTIDDDTPTTTISAPAAGEYVPGDGIVSISGAATDPTSYISQVEVNVANGGWQVAAGTEAWTTNVDAGGLGEGAVSVAARATDAVGHVGSAVTQNFILDRTPPTATVNESGILRPTRNMSGTWTVSLSGTVSDPNAGGEPGSGVAGVNVALAADAPLAGNGRQSATVAGNAWSLAYQLPPIGADSPSGVYTVTVRATDGVSNTSDATSTVQLITLDVAGPVITLSEPPTTTQVITTGLTFSGQALDDHPVLTVEVSLNPAEQIAALDGTILHLPFDEIGALAYHADQSGANNAAVCDDASCPLPNQAGQRGAAVVFGGSSQLRVRNTNLLTRSFSLGTWVNRTTIGVETDLLSQGIGAQRLSFGFLASGAFRCGFGGSNLDTSEVYEASGWQQWVCTYDADSGLRAIYLDGTAVATDTVASGALPNGALYVGSNALSGLLDEVVVYNRALADYEVNDLYDYGRNAWQAVELSGTSNPTWSYTIPTGDNGIEGYYQFNVRGTDALGNVTPLGQQRLWRGEIDTRAPDVFAGYQIDESGSVPTTTYYCVASDLNLSQDESCQAVAPASLPAFRVSDVVETSYDEINPWYGTFFTNVVSLYEIDAVRTYSGTQPVDASLVACDAYGNCTTAALDPVTDAPSADRGVEILYPSSGTVFTALEPVVVTGDAFDVTGLDILYVYANDRPIYGISWLGYNVTEATWSFTWTPEAEGSYDLQTRLLSKEDVAVSAALEERGLFERFGGPEVQGETSRLVAQEDEASANEGDGVAETYIVDVVTQLYLTLIIQNGESAQSTYRAYMPHLEHTVAQEPFVGEVNAVIVDLAPAIIGVNTLELTSRESLATSVVNVSGRAVDTLGLERVEARIGNGKWSRAKVAEDGSWQLGLWLDGPVDGQTYDVYARAVDFAGRTSNITATVYIDTVAPVPEKITLSYFNAANEEFPLLPGKVITDATVLQIQWEDVADGSGELTHKVGFTNNLDPSDAELTTFDGSDVYRQAVSSGERLYAHIIHIDAVGNRRVLILGPFEIE